MDPRAGFSCIIRNAGGHQRQSANAVAFLPHSLQLVSLAQASSTAGGTLQLISAAAHLANASMALALSAHNPWVQSNVSC